MRIVPTTELALLACLGLLLLCPNSALGKPCHKQKRHLLLIHGGAGAGKSPPEVLKRQRAVMVKALRLGHGILNRGGTSVDAVEAAVRFLEDSPLFNASRGGIPNREGFVELDASIMEGRQRNAGAVAAVRVIKNPIVAARVAMERSPHLMFVDRGAVKFARANKLEIVSPSYFLVPRLKKGPGGKSGTVGAVALDRCGDLAAATSTGGYNTKVPGRVGDSPIIGAGTYANNKTCAVSATGHGEYFIRFSAAHDVSALVEYKGWSIKKAASHVIHHKLKPAGGRGGFIVLDRKGNMAWPYSSQGMIRGYIKHTGEMKLGVWKEMK